MFEWLRRALGSGPDGGRSQRTASGELPPDVQRLALRFEGQVQGVGFRWNSQSCAHETGCTGWVRNEDDGSVTMELQGTPEQIERWFAALERAYERLHVTYRVASRRDLAPVAGETTFTVRA